MPVKMHQVSYFLALCEEQNFTRAARRCGVAQPSLTRAIQQLAQEFGKRLFKRENMSVRLTDLGAYLRPDFEQIDRAATQIVRRSQHSRLRHRLNVKLKQWRPSCV